jgi:hypothetical protein
MPILETPAHGSEIPQGNKYGQQATLAMQGTLKFSNGLAPESRDVAQSLPFALYPQNEKVDAVCSLGHRKSALLNICPVDWQLELFQVEACRFGVKSMLDRQQQKRWGTH